MAGEYSSEYQVRNIVINWYSYNTAAMLHLLRRIVLYIIDHVLLDKQYHIQKRWQSSR
jgi:hypothetical protein